MKFNEYKINDALFLQRCFDLAKLGEGAVAPNPMVGAVVVYQNKIIGEGYHQVYGKAHAEVNAINSIPTELKYLLPQSTLYVSLEPCCFFGKTPACTDLIIQSKIPKVVIAALDATPEVSGKGVEILRKHGVEVIVGILKKEGDTLVRPRTVFVQQNRPYLILKYAQSKDGFIGRQNERLIISHLYTQRLVHKWRSEVDAILVGTNTALLDNPHLNNRLYFGKSPIRLVLDKSGRLPKNHHIFDDSQPTLIFTAQQKVPSRYKQTEWINMDFPEHFLTNLLTELYHRKIGVVLIEGGRKLLQSFIDANLWDEARVITANKHLNYGVKAPLLPNSPSFVQPIYRDELAVYYNQYLNYQLSSFT